jgi:hypothetical protein
MLQGAIVSESRGREKGKTSTNPTRKPLRCAGIFDRAGELKGVTQTPISLTRHHTDSTQKKVA